VTTAGKDAEKDAGQGLVAVTGATGFIGAALIDKLLDRGVRVRALARNPARLKRANNLYTEQGDLDDEAALIRLVDGAGAVIHLAGVTNAPTEQDYLKINAAGAGRAAGAAAKAGARFIYASSMSARAPDASPYAMSKFEGERAVAAAKRCEFLSLRLPAIYGPGDVGTLPYFKLIKSGFALEPATDEPARASLLFVEDAAEALLAAITKAEPGVVYEVGDDKPDGYSWAEIGKALGDAFGASPIAVRVPKPAVALYHQGVRAADRALGRAPSMRQGQVNEFFHPDWVARDNLFSKAAGWAPTTPLAEGFAKTIRWYQEQDLL